MNKIKSLFSKKVDGEKLDIEGVENENDYWDAAWDAHKGFIAAQFVQSMVQGSTQEVVPVPFLTDANHYELSAAATESPYVEQLGTGASVASFMIQPSVFTMIDGVYTNQAVPEFTAKKDFLRSPQNAIGARYGSFKDRDNFEVVYCFYNPRIYTMTTNLTGMKMSLPADFADTSVMFVIDKIWVCDKITGTLAIKLPKGKPKKVEMEYLAEAGKGLNPAYGVPICFSVKRYCLNLDQVIQSTAEYNIGEMTSGVWEKKSARTLEPLNPRQDGEAGSFQAATTQDAEYVVVQKQ